MRIIFKHGDGLVSMDVENPTGNYLPWTLDFQEKFESYLKPDFNEDYTDIIETATPEEIAEATKEVVPVLISRMGLKIQLRILNIDISEVEKTIRELPDWMMSPLEKDLAVIKFNDAAYYDRYNADYNLIATMMGLSQEQLDQIHINGNKV